MKDQMKNSLAGLIRSVHFPVHELPRGLPLSHLSKEECLAGIIHDGVLKPQIHALSNEMDTPVYLMYGGVFYRSSTSPTRNRSQAPVAFVFHPRMLKQVHTYYPFDTGMVRNKIGGTWTKTLEPVHLKYEIEGLGDQLIPRKLVRYMFGTNDNYLQGQPVQNPDEGHPTLTDLFNFYAADLTVPDPDDGRAEGVDRRQSVIECQVKSEVSILEDLIWIGMPDQDQDLFMDLLDKHTDPDNLRFHFYDTPMVYRPNELEKELEDKARQEILDKMLYRERRGRHVVQPSI
jgi:hypothetical protein